MRVAGECNLREPRITLHSEIMLTAALLGALAFHVPQAHRRPYAATQQSLSRGSVWACASGDWTTTPTGLKLLDTTVGDGEEAATGSVVLIHYTSRVVGGEDLDTSKGKKPIQFELGKDDVIPGWTEGLQGMKAGGTRTMQIPPSLWSGATGMAAKVPSGATLEFDMGEMQRRDPTPTWIACPLAATLLLACCETQRLPDRALSPQSYSRRKRWVLWSASVRRTSFSVVRLC